MDKSRLSSIELRNFKAFRTLRLSLRELNVLAGPNNCGKSTVLGACRALAVALRHANIKKREVVQGIEGHTHGWHIKWEHLPISVENVHYNYRDEEAVARFVFEGGNQLALHFPIGGGCILTSESARAIRTLADFKREFPARVHHVPILGPLEHEETFVEKETVVRAQGSHRASRHFRNYWYHFPDEFTSFAALVESSWPKMSIERPTLVRAPDLKLAMFCKEDRVAREVFWAGFGFQVWCQLLTHLSQANRATLLILDEPETYLHPSLQRQLLSMLRELGAHILMATHSTEIMSDAEPSEIVVIDKQAGTAKRLDSIESVQGALEAIGSVQNITLTELSRHRRVVFVEGHSDIKLIRRFARKLGLGGLSGGDNISAVTLDGFSNWERVKGAAWAIEKALGTKLAIAVVCDRDYRCDNEISEIEKELRTHVRFVHFHRRKEIENYLLIPDVIQRLVAKHDAGVAAQLEDTMNSLAEKLKTKVQSRFLAQWADYHGHKHRAPTTVTEDALNAFNDIWSSLPGKLSVVPGKEYLANLRTVLQQSGIGLGDGKIVAEIRRDEIPVEVAELMMGLQEFTTT